MKDELKKLYDKLLLILDENDEGKEALRKIRFIHEEKEKKLNDGVESWREDTDKCEREIDKLNDENENLFYKIKILIDKTKHSEDIKSKLRGERESLKEELDELVLRYRGAAIRGGIWRKKHDDLIGIIENIHEICVYSRHTNIDNLRRRIRQAVDEHIKYCKKCKIPEYRCPCESDKT